EERGEPLLPILSCCFMHSLECAEHAGLVLSLGRVALLRVPFGRSPSLRRLLRRLPDFVRLLLRYYGTVRLLAFVHHRRVPLGFPLRSAVPSTADEREISPLPARCFRACTGSTTARGPRVPRLDGALGVAFHSLRRRRLPGVRISRLDT